MIALGYYEICGNFNLKDTDAKQLDHPERRIISRWFVITTTTVFTGRQQNSCYLAG